MVFSKESSLFASFTHNQKKTAHWALNTFGLVSILTAFAAIYYNKEENGRPHFTSWHGLIGISTIGYTIVQYFAGHNLTVFNFLAKKIIPYNRLAMYHATSGTFLYVLACLSLSLGIYSNWFSQSAPFLLWYLCFAFTAMLGLIITNQVTAKYVLSRGSSQQSSTKQSAGKSNKAK